MTALADLAENERVHGQGLEQLPGLGWEMGRRRGLGCAISQQSHHQSAALGEVCHPPRSKDGVHACPADRQPGSNCEGCWEREALALPVLLPAKIQEVGGFLKHRYGLWILGNPKNTSDKYLVP